MKIIEVRAEALAGLIKDGKACKHTIK